MTTQRKLITFLGASQYQNTLYCNPRMGGDPPTVASPFVQEALLTFFQPDVTVVFLTETAKNNRPKGDPNAESYWVQLERILEAKTQVQSVAIPDNPQTEADVWAIFQRIQENVTEGDTLIFDITNAFRSIPVVALVAVSYLRLVCGVTIEALVYGAFVPGQERTSIVDVLPIASLLDWTSAADQFLKTGVAQPLARLVQPTVPGLADNLRGISQGLELLRPYNVMQQAAKLPASVAQAENTIGANLPPLSALLDRVSADYGQFALDKPHNKLNRREMLLRQFALIEWYWTKKQVVHVVAMAREWMVTLLCLRLDLNPEGKNERDGVEALLNERTPRLRSFDYGPRWDDIPKGGNLRRIWQSKRRDCQDCLELAELRNSIAHAGQNGGMSEEKVMERAAQILEKLRLLRDAAARGDYDPIPGPPPSTPSGEGGGATIGERLHNKAQDLPPR